MRRRFSIWQAAWAALVVAGHVALLLGLKSDPQWIELALLAVCGVLVVLVREHDGLRPRPTRLEAVLRIALAAIETAAAAGWFAYALLVSVAPPRTAEGHPTMPLGQAFLATLVFGVAGVLTAVVLARAGSRAAFATRLALAGCAISTAISLAR